VPTYDEPGNQLLEIEEPVVREILDGFRRQPTRPGTATRFAIVWHFQLFAA
jgi:hypothetical protein